MKKYIILIILFSLIFLSSCIQGNNNTIQPIPDIEKQILPTSCIDEMEWEPVITSISTNSGMINTKIEINGCNFSGFEWDKHVWIENEQWIKWILYWEEWSTSKSINFTLKTPLCQYDTSYSGMECESWLELIPWKYKIYVIPWWKVSNKIDFIINKSDNIIEESTSEILRKLLAEKYPKYSDTIKIKIEKETSNHARGLITFVSGKAGWYFLAAKINWKWQIILDWNWQISCNLSEYWFPADMLSDCFNENQIDLSYQDIINYLNYNITDIITKYSDIKPANWQWFADWFWFTSINYVYVDYEDGHYLYRALLKCDNPNNILSCNPQAIFEDQKWWVVIQWEDSQKDNDIIYKWAVDYEWKR